MLLLEKASVALRWMLLIQLHEKRMIVGIIVNLNVQRIIYGLYICPVIGSVEIISLKYQYHVL